MSDQQWRTDLSRSATDFERIVWPKVCELNWLGGGRLQIVEGATDWKLEIDLDQLAGIDAWHIDNESGYMRGIGSRVQWGCKFDTFTIRTNRQSGVRTELDKRLEAIDRHQDRGDLYPFVTVHAYLDEPGGALLSAAMVRTRDLFEYARRNPQPTRRAQDPSGDWADFMPYRWADLIRHGITVKTFDASDARQMSLLGD